MAHKRSCPDYAKGPVPWAHQHLVVYPDGRKVLVDVLQVGRSEGCIGTLIDRLTSPSTCVILTAGDFSWCDTCGHQFDTNSEDGNLPPKCQLELDPIRGGALT